jgi:NDP-sugar pyrophosphorylase family protein
MARIFTEYQVAVIAGGEGSRLIHRTRDVLPKYLLGIYNGKILDYVLYPWIKAGLQDYHFLISGKFLNQTERCMRRRYKNLNVDYSVEHRKLGKGGALRKAIVNEVVDGERPTVVIFGDDIFVMPNFGKRFLEAHEKNMGEGRIVTLARTAELRTEFGMPVVSKADPTQIVDFVEKPLVKVPASAGAYIAEPKFYQIILKEPRVFNTEDEVFSELARKGLLGGFTMPYNCWLSVNDEKEFKTARAELKKLDINLNL